MRFLSRLLLLVVLLVAVLLFNTLRLPKHQLAKVSPAPVLPLMPDSVTAHLAGALRIPTVSRTSYADTDTVAFDQFGGYLQRTFPLVHQKPLTITPASTSGPVPTRP
jgi:carboxypeptidase PM20D1